MVPRLMPNVLHTIHKYGNFSFTWMGPRPRVYVTDLNVLRELLSDYHKYKKPFEAINPIAKLLISTGLASMEGDEWAKCRFKLNPAFRMEKLKSMVPAVQVCAENILSEWEKMTSAGGGSCVIDIIHHLEIYTSSVLAQLMFGSTYTEKIKQTFFKLLELESLGKLSTDLLTLPGQEYFPTKKNRQAHKIDQFIRDSIKSMIDERLETRKAREIDTGAGDGKDLLDLFMDELYQHEKTKSGGNRRKMIEDVVGQCKIFFFAGFGSTSNSICWAMVMLSIHKHWQERAREEVMRVVGHKKEISAEDLSQLKVITMIVTEVLRLFPASMELSRLIVEDTKIGGYTIPKGTVVTCPILLMSWSPEVWGHDAKEFNPQRFAEGVAKATKKYGLAQYMPFGCGPRICIAQNLAVIELKMFLALLVRKFEFELSPEYKHGPHVDFTIHPQYGAPLVLREL
uniref:Secologanin synthase 2 n=1 Tax=Centranthera grandiflora TaxID=2491184 RepID=A0A5S9H943_9LAMI|nr:secologanin synthase 2 [Centranthera grandiflora]